MKLPHLWEWSAIKELLQTLIYSNRVNKMQNFCTDDIFNLHKSWKYSLVGFIVCLSIMWASFFKPNKSYSVKTLPWKAFLNKPSIHFHCQQKDSLKLYASFFLHSINNENHNSPYLWTEDKTPKSYRISHTFFFLIPVFKVWSVSKTFVWLLILSVLSAYENL